MNIEEHVPTNIPKNTNILKLFIASPPSKINAKFASSVVSTVIVVLERV